MPHDSDDAANSAGSHGVAHKGTAPRLCSKRPVYTMTTRDASPATT